MQRAAVSRPWVGQVPECVKGRPQRWVPQDLCWPPRPQVSQGTVRLGTERVRGPAPPVFPPPATGRGNRRWEGTPVPGGPRPLPPSPSSGCHQGRTQVPADPRKEGCARPIGTKGHGQHSGKKKHLIIRGKAERCAAGGGRKQVSGEAVAAGSGKADRLLPRCPHEAQQNCRGRGGGRTGTHSLSISDHAGQEAGEGSHRPPQSSREASWAGPSPAAHHADPTQGLGAPGLTHPPSSGSHTRCRRQMWS